MLASVHPPLIPPISFCPILENKLKYRIARRVVLDALDPVAREGLPVCLVASVVFFGSDHSSVGLSLA
jgi:hypothetical protein